MGLLTELTLRSQTADLLVFETSKKKAIFSTAFLASSVILGMMWFAVKDLFRVMTQTSGSWVDFGIVGVFYAALVIYPILGVGFLGFHRALRLDRKTRVLERGLYLFGKAFRRERYDLNLVERFEARNVRKGLNVAHQHQHLAGYQNAGYWEVVAYLKGVERPVSLDRNTEQKEMEALALTLNAFLRAPTVNDFADSN